MTLDQIIAIVGHIATWITVVIVFLTLREMVIQRRTSYRPDIVVAQRAVYGYWQEQGTLMLPTLWSERELNQEERKNVFRSFSIRLFNLGLGAAKDVELRWDFDIAAVAQTVKDVCYKNSLPIVVENASVHGFPHALRTPLSIRVGSQLGVTNLDLDLKGRHDYLLPVSVRSEGLEVRLPSSVQNLVSILVYLMITDPKSGALRTLEENLALELHVAYKDIGGAEHKKKFIGRVHLVIVSDPADKQGELGFRGWIDLSDRH